MVARQGKGEGTGGAGLRCCVVTGGAGFIGSATVRLLAGEGWSVRVLDNMSTGNRRNLAGLTGPQVEVIEGDVRDRATCRRACEGAGYVFHLAAIPGVAPSILNPAETFGANVGGTHTLLLACRDASVKRLVFASSCAVYGDTAGAPVNEDVLPRPLSPYAASKLAGEAYCHAYWKAYGLETVVLRYFNVYGPRQDPSSEYAAVVPTFMTRVIQRLPPVIFGDGSQSRDFVHVSDVARANLLAALAEGAAGRVFNIGSGRALSIRELAMLVSAACLAHGGRDRQAAAETAETAEVETEAATKIEFAPARAGEVRFSRADIARAGSVLGYSPAVTIEEGLRKTADWFAACPPD